MKLSSSTLRKAAEIQERIEKLESELKQMLQGASIAAVSGETRDVADESEVTPKASATTSTRGRRVKPVALNGRARGRRSRSPSGPLAPAVVSVLKSNGSPMGVNEILEGLVADGYKFNSPEPKKNLFARIYRLRGVKQVGPGQFAAE